MSCIHRESVVKVSSNTQKHAAFGIFVCVFGRREWNWGAARSFGFKIGDNSWLIRNGKALGAAKRFSLVSRAWGSVAFEHAWRGRGEITSIELPRCSIRLQGGLNALAVGLSFGFVILVVLGSF